jgi:hypothetical protein
MPEPKIELGSGAYGADLDPSIERACDARFFVDLAADSLVLDLMSFGGRVASLAAHSGARVVCLAESPEAAAGAKRLFGEEGAEGIRVVCGDPAALPFAESLFDCAFDLHGEAEGRGSPGDSPEIRRVVKRTGSLLWGRLSRRKYGKTPWSAAVERIGKLFGSGSDRVDVYAVIPSARDPRAHLPIGGANAASVYTRFFAARFFSAEGPRSRFLRYLAMRPSLGSLLLGFAPSRVLAARGRRPDGGGVERLLREATGARDVDVFALSGAWRGPDVASFAVFIGFEKGGLEPSAIAKVCRRPAFNESLDQEFNRTAMIRQKVGKAAAESIPRPLAKGTVQACRGAVFEWAPGDDAAHLLKTARPGARMGLFERILGPAAGFLMQACRETGARVSCPTLPLGSRDATAAEVVALAARESRLDLSIQEVGRLQEAAAVGLGTVSCLGHGDFAPCNVRLDGEKIWVLDWELASGGRTPMFDLATFLAHSFGDISPSDSGLGLLAEAFDGNRRRLPARVHEAVSGALAAFGIERALWGRFFPIYCVSEMLRDLLYFRLGTQTRWRTALRVAL